MAARRRRPLLSDSVGAITAIEEVRSSPRLGGAAIDRVGEPDIKKLVATQGLWEARVTDPTGAYRMFFRFGRIGDRRIAAVAHGRKKSGQSLPRSVIDVTQRKVDAFLAELGANGLVDQEQ